MATPCFDDPGTIHQTKVCLFAVSKDLKGQFGPPHAQAQQCPQPQCKTLKVSQSLKIEVPGVGSPCDSPLSRNLGGTIVIDRLVSAFDQDGNHRGFHAGDFVWTGVGGTKATGRISGMTNEGTHRKPVFDPACQKCDTPGVMEGRLCGQITDPDTPPLNNAQIFAAYRFKIDPTANGPSGAMTGTLEGVIISKCS